MKKILVALFCFMFMSLNAADHLMVWTNSAKLYNEQGREVLIIPRGELVQAIIHPKDNSLYAIKYQGQRYNSPRKFFKSLEDMVLFYKKRLIDYQGIMKENDLKISEIDSELLIMHVKALELRRDTAIAYKKVSYNGSGVGQIGFRSSLSEGKFKKLMKEWSEGYAKIVTEKKALNAENLKLTVAQDKAKRQLGNLGNLVKRFAEGNKKKYLTLFVKSSKGARLYKKNKIIKYLSEDESAQGVLDKNHPGWYKILVDEVVYQVSSEDVAESDKYLESLKNKVMAAEFEITYLNKEVDSHQFRLKLYTGISRQLEADKFVQGGYGVVKNYTVPIDKDNTFTLESPDATKLYINSSKAGRVLEEWEKEAADLAQLSLAQQKRVINLQKASLDYSKTIRKLKESIKAE